MKKFDTRVQEIKYRVLKEMAKLAWEDKLNENLLSIPEKIISGDVPAMRCCIAHRCAEVCEGIEQCWAALLKKRAGVLQANYIEGMACIGGAGCVTHEIRDKKEVDAYGKQGRSSIQESIRNFEQR